MPGTSACRSFWEKSSDAHKHRARRECFRRARFIKYKSELSGVLPANLADLLLVGLLGRVPALVGHLLVDVALHAQAVVQRGIEGLLYILGGGLNRAVHIKVAHALRGQQDVFHDRLIVHCARLPYTN